jgi:hypothetical protein
LPQGAGCMAGVCCAPYTCNSFNKCM